MTWEEIRQHFPYCHSWNGVDCWL